jgi:hypothetical protein
MCSEWLLVSGEDKLSHGLARFKHGYYEFRFELEETVMFWKQEG